MQHILNFNKKGIGNTVIRNYEKWCNKKLV